MTDPHHVTAPKYRRYDRTAMTDAYNAVIGEKMSVGKAAKHFAVPDQTLRDRVSGKVSLDCVSSGPSPLFDEDEEEKLVKHLQVAANLGYGYTRQEVVDIAMDYCVQLGKRKPDEPLSLKWFRKFIKRWPELHALKPKPWKETQAKATSLSVLTSHFGSLKEVLQKYNLEDKPHLIFNIAERGVTQNHTQPHVTSGKHQVTTILGCGSASGKAVPPFFVFAGKRMMPRLLEGATPGVSSMMTQSGLSNTNVFRHYLQDHFVKFIPDRDPDQFLLLLLDGHKSHIAVDIMEWAEDNKIVLFILPAHTSNMLQPLDIACFGPFQEMYSSECHKFIRTNSSGITRYDVCGIACKVYAKAFCAENLLDAFCETGVYPFNSSAISD